MRTGPAGTPSRAARAASTSAWAVRRASVRAGERRRRSRASLTDAVVVVAVEDGGELGGVGAALAEEVEDGEGADPGPEVAAGDLAGHSGVAGDVQQVVAELEGPPDPLAELGQRVHHRRVGSGQGAAEAAGGRDQGAGLVGEHGQVVLDRVVARAGAADLADLALGEPRDRPGQHPGGLGAEAGRDLRGPGEQVVAGEHGHLVVEAGVGRALAPAQLGLVHDVVVVEAGQVGELDGHRRPDQAGLVRVAGVAGDQDQGRAQPLAAGGDQVAGGLLRRTGRRWPPPPPAPPRPGPGRP